MGSKSDCIARFVYGEQMARTPLQDRLSKLAGECHEGDRKGGNRTLSLTVKSSSLLPCPESISTEGLMQTGGTGMCVMMRYSGLSATSSKMQSSAVMAEKRASTRKGLKSSATYTIPIRDDEQNAQR